MIGTGIEAFDFFAFATAAALAFNKPFFPPSIPPLRFSRILRHFCDSSVCPAIWRFDFWAFWRLRIRPTPQRSACALAMRADAFTINLGNLFQLAVKPNFPAVRRKR
jgi:hypothetical protein